jgi:hypothetical protein
MDGTNTARMPAFRPRVAKRRAPTKGAGLDEQLFRELLSGDKDPVETMKVRGEGRGGYRHAPLTHSHISFLVPIHTHRHSVFFSLN